METELSTKTSATGEPEQVLTVTKPQPDKVTEYTKYQLEAIQKQKQNRLEAYKAELDMINSLLDQFK